MASTQTLRNWYPELVVAGVDSYWRVIGTLKCAYWKCVTVRFYAGGAAYPDGYVDLRVHPAAGEAFRALATVFRHYGYQFKETAGGSAVCRKITNGSRTSPHAHGTAVDFNPSKNSYRYHVGPIQWGIQTDMPKVMVDAALAIRTKNGKRVFDWGGLWTNVKDPMHWELDVSQSDLATGIDWSTVQGIPVTDEEDSMFCRKGDTGDKVKAMQILLVERGYPLPRFGTDADFGGETATALAAFQRDSGIADEVDYYGPRSYAAMALKPGPEGPKGDPGPAGQDGEDGEQGVKGDTGDKGPSPKSVTFRITGAEFEYE